MSERLKFVSEQILDDLVDGVPSNLERYVSGDFSDLAEQYGWDIETTTVRFEADKLAELRGGPTTPEDEVHNSLVVHEALQGLRPSLAREERIWVRLCHTEGLEYARSRWLRNIQPEKLEGQVRTHFFAETLNRVRDDNALGRLWWNAEIAKIACPDDMKHGLDMLLKSADIRLSLIERSRTGGRPTLLRAIIGVLDADPWLTSHETHFREFMKVLNRDGGGLLLESLPSSAVSDLMRRSVERSQQIIAKEHAIT